MPRDLRICEEKEWFLGVDDYLKEYPICYRYVICYSLLSYLHSVGLDKDKGLSVLQELQKAIDSESKDNFKKDNFIELFHLKKNCGFVVVDQSNGI